MKALLTSRYVNQRGAGQHYFFKCDNFTELIKIILMKPKVKPKVE